MSREARGEGEAMTARHEPFSPTWWAAWTFALARPGRLDDEEVPDAPAETDDCRLHDGRCSGACEMEADRWA